MIRGQDFDHRDRLRDDKPKTASAPELPPGAILSAAEQAVWDWLLRTTYVSGLHGTSDGVAFLRCARLIVRAQDVDEKIAKDGLTARNPRTLKLESTAHARLSRDLWAAISTALAEIGATPVGRVRMASAKKNSEQFDLWDAID
jgi:hypothetical protein